MQCPEPASQFLTSRHPHSSGEVQVALQLLAMQRDLHGEHTLHWSPPALSWKGVKSSRFVEGCSLVQSPCSHSSKSAARLGWDHSSLPCSPPGASAHSEQRWEPQKLCSEVRFLEGKNLACNKSCLHSSRARLLPASASAFFAFTVPHHLLPSTISRSWKADAWTLTTRRSDRAKSPTRNFGRPWRSLRSPRK